MSRDDQTATKQQQDQDSQKQDDAGQAEDRSPAEWVSFGISVAILLIVIGLLGYEHFTRGNRPPLIEATARTQEIRHEGEAYYVPVHVTNRGDTTAGDVQIAVTLTTAGQDEETAEFAILFLAGGESADGTVVLTSDPAQGELEVQVLSFISP